MRSRPRSSQSTIDFISFISIQSFIDDYDKEQNGADKDGNETDNPDPVRVVRFGTSAQASHKFLAATSFKSDTGLKHGHVGKKTTETGYKKTNQSSTTHGTIELVVLVESHPGGAESVSALLHHRVVDGQQTYGTHCRLIRGTTFEAGERNHRNPWVFNRHLKAL